MDLTQLQGLTPADLTFINKLFERLPADKQNQLKQPLITFHNTLIGAGVITCKAHKGNKKTGSSAGITYKVGKYAVTSLDFLKKKLKLLFYRAGLDSYPGQHTVFFAEKDWCGYVYLGADNINEALKCVMSSAQLILNDPVKSTKIKVGKESDATVSNPNDKIKDYLSAFKMEAPAWFAKATFVQSNYNFFLNFFKQENLEKAEWLDIQQMGEHLHCFQSYAIAKTNALGKMNHPIEHYRKSFIFLAHGAGSPEERIRKFCDDSKYSLKFIGKSAVGELAGYLFPDQFMIVNSRDQEAAEFLGLEIERIKGGDLTAKLVAFQKATRPVADLYEKIVGSQTDLPINLEVDQFFSWIYENHVAETQEVTAEGRHYWTFAPGKGAALWDEFYQKGIMAIGCDQIDSLAKLTSKEEVRVKYKDLWPGAASSKNDIHACWQFAHVIKKGDIIFAKQGNLKLLGYGVVEGDYVFDSTREQFKHVRKVNWLSKGEWKLEKANKMAIKMLTDITPYPDFVKLISTKVGLDSSPTLQPVDPAKVAYWWLNANPKNWNFHSYKIGDLQTYTAYNDKGSKRKTFIHFSAVKPGDLLLVYVTKPDKAIVGLCKITQALHGRPGQEEFEFQKIEHFDKTVTWNELHSIPELKNCKPMISNQGSLFAVTPEEYEIIRTIIDKRNLDPKNVKNVPYTKDDAHADLFMSKADLEAILNRIKRKKAIILQGPPGVGKTFVARRLAFALMGERDECRVTMVQFHPSYGYEDFVQGFRPTSDGLERRDGVFIQFARSALKDPDRDWFFIIDEINRGNLAKIFGELLMLIEADKRGPKNAIPLTYSESLDEKFEMPKNLYIIGTMNTADRSLAMVDYALRRRFAFMTLNPEFDSPTFTKWLRGKKVPDKLIERIRNKIGVLNGQIDKERDLGPGFRIGHSFFCPSDSDIPNETWYGEIIDSEIKPLLEEYFDSHNGRVKELVDALML